MRNWSAAASLKATTQQTGTKGFAKVAATTRCCGTRAMANSAPEPIDQVRSLMAAWAASQPVAIPHTMSTRVTACPAGVTYNGPRWPWLVGANEGATK